MSEPRDPSFEEKVEFPREELCRTAIGFHTRGWMLGTSGNLSAVAHTHSVWSNLAGEVPQGALARRGRGALRRRRAGPVPLERRGGPAGRRGRAARPAPGAPGDSSLVRPLRRAEDPGELAGQVYPDVAPARARWRHDGRRVAIFSSGSALAQELLFRYSTAGDLTGQLSGYFDTTHGPKREPRSYSRIAEALGVAPAEVLFVSDVIAELDAAAETGMSAALSVRDGAPLPRSTHGAVRSFDELDWC